MNIWEMLSLKGKIAVITGGAGNYGRQMVEAQAEGGARASISQISAWTRRSLQRRPGKPRGMMYAPCKLSWEMNTGPRLLVDEAGACI